MNSNGEFRSKISQNVIHLGQIGKSGQSGNFLNFHIFLIYSWLSLSGTPSISNLSLSRTKVSVPLCKLWPIFLSLSRTLSISNKFSGPLRVRDRESELYMFFLYCNAVIFPWSVLLKKRIYHQFNWFTVLDILSLVF